MTRPLLSFQHSAFAQVYLPYKKPTQLSLERWNGNTALMLRSTPLLDLETQTSYNPGIPYGPKARLILHYIHRQAIIYNSPTIDVCRTFTAFVRDVASFYGSKDIARPNIRTMNAYKEQLVRLSGCQIIFAGRLDDGHTLNERTTIIEKIAFMKNTATWAQTITLSARYYASLREHAIPLDSLALGALSDSALAIDVYTWLAHRLRRVPPNDAHFIGWANLHHQFGQGYGRIRDFRFTFRHVLARVLEQYPAARGNVLEYNKKGLWLIRTPPPVDPR